jgi:RNA polymerase sigma factor (sigma-70 family)
MAAGRGRESNAVTTRHMGKRLPQSTPDPLASDHRQWVLAALDQFEGRLVRYAQRLLGDIEQARDVVQFVFLRLCDQSPDCIGDRLAQWLYTVCRNRALDVLRSRGGVAVGPEAAHSSPGLPFGHAQPPYSRENDPADAAEQAELHALLRLLIEELPASQREALDLWSDGFDYQQIASIIDRQEGHVRVLVHRALKTLREHPRVRAVLEDTERGGGPRSAKESRQQNKVSPVHGACSP